MLRWLFAKIFKRNVIGVFYIPPVIQMLLCYQTFSTYQDNNILGIIISHFVTIVAASVAISINLRRFVLTLQKPYHRENIHVVLSSIFTTVTLFAVIYSLLYVSIPNSFVGLNGATVLDNAVNALYFSTITFTTLGFGDIYPVASIAKVFVSLEAMSFVIFFSILVSNHKVFFKSGGSAREIVDLQPPTTKSSAK